MVIGGVVAIFFGVAAEGKSLEDVATPLSVIAKPSESIFRTGVDTKGIDATASNSDGSFGGGSTMTGTRLLDTEPTSVPDPRPGGHDDPAHTRPPDDGMPLA
jgi:hypothetical protein